MRSNAAKTATDMQGYNNVTLCGKLVEAPYIDKRGNKSYARLMLATGKKNRDKATGELREQVNNVQLYAFGALVDLAETYLRKGASVLVLAHVHAQEATTKAGESYIRQSIIADQIIFMSAGTGKKSGAADPSAPEMDIPF